jgi:hypothetical protein
MILTELDQIAEYGHAGDFGQPFYFGSIGLIEVAIEDDQDGEDADC